jgi:hypothetical protein
MGYNIELSFNIFKSGSINQILDRVKSYSEECGSTSFQYDYEFENNIQFQRRHCVISLDFPNEKINNMIEFLHSIRKQRDLHIEMIYDVDNHSILYASQYYVSQKMDKGCAKVFRAERRERSYSDDEIDILNSVKK